MKPPKNFYSNLDRRKQGLPEVPEASAADAGKVLTVDNAGALEFANVPSELPTVTSADAGKVLTVDNQGAWGAESNIEIVSFTGTSQPLIGTLTFSEPINNIVNRYFNSSNKRYVFWGVYDDDVMGRLYKTFFSILHTQKASSFNGITLGRMYHATSNKIYYQEVFLSSTNTSTSTTTTEYALT